MNGPDYNDQNALATLVCKKPGKNGKKPDCTCGPCNARRAIFSQNVGIVEQENRRMALSKGKITSLTQWAPEET